MEKKKTRFFLIIGVLIVLTISSWLFMARGLKETYRVLGNDTPEVKAQINVIKDYRKLKGYKIIKNEDEYKMIMISAGLTYGKEDKIEITDVNFDSDEIVITVKESIDPAPEKEVINYPFTIIKVDSNKNKFKIVSTTGEEYTAIDLNSSTDNSTQDKEHNNDSSNNDTDKNESNLNADNQDTTTDDTSSEDKTSNNEVNSEDSSNDEDEDEQDTTPTSHQVSVEYQGRIDDESIEVKIGENYSTFYLSDSVKSKINNYDAGSKITLKYIEENGQRRVIGVN